MNPSRALCVNAAYVVAAVCVYMPVAEGIASGNIILSETASFLGEAEYDWASEISGEQGDINGDGFGDVVIGAYGNDDNGDMSGQAYLVFGRDSGWGALVDLDSVSTSYIGESEGDWFGFDTLHTGGDLNGDGLFDVVVGAMLSDRAFEDAGAVFVVFGRSTGWMKDTPATAADVVFTGEAAFDWAGRMISAGDLDGDGIDDLVAGACAYGGSRGKVYVVLGRTSGWPTIAGLEQADATMVGEHSDDWAFRVDAGRDANGDGLEDLLVGAIGNNDGGDDAGKVYFVPGTPSIVSYSEVVLGLAPGSFVGEEPGDDAGISVALAEDLNGDTLDDILIGARGNDENGYYSGQAYVVFGRQAGWTQNFDLSAADASFLGESDWDLAGNAVDGAGDVDGDGLGDIIIGAYGNSEAFTGAGQIYAVLGRTLGWGQDSLLSSADGSFFGTEAGENAGLTLAGAGDLDGDGLADILVGAHFNSLNGTHSGRVYLISGSPCWDVDWDQVGACDGDCDDNDPLAYPGAPEQCDGQDNDCDGIVDNGVDEDGDGDGYTPCQGDCDDLDGSRHPSAGEVCDGLDNDCDPTTDEDVDGDGDDQTICQFDCDDSDAAVYFGAAESCDGADTDCNGVVDDMDGDHDGYSPCGPAIEDCDDSDPYINPASAEDCEDGIDNDCDGQIDGSDPECPDSDDDSSDDDDSSAIQDDDDDSSPEPGDDDVTEPGCGCVADARRGPGPGMLGLLLWFLIRSSLRRL